MNFKLLKRTTKELVETTCMGPEEVALSDMVDQVVKMREMFEEMRRPYPLLAIVKLLLLKIGHYQLIVSDRRKYTNALKELYDSIPYNDDQDVMSTISRIGLKPGYFTREFKDEKDDDSMFNHRLVKDWIHMYMEGRTRKDLEQMFDPLVLPVFLSTFDYLLQTYNFCDVVSIWIDLADKNCHQEMLNPLPSECARDVEMITKKCGRVSMVYHEINGIGDLDEETVPQILLKLKNTSYGDLHPESLWYYGTGAILPQNRYREYRPSDLHSITDFGINIHHQGKHKHHDFGGGHDRHCGFESFYLCSSLSHSILTALQKCPVNGNLVAVLGYEKPREMETYFTPNLVFPDDCEYWEDYVNASRLERFTDDEEGYGKLKDTWKKRPEPYKKQYSDDDLYKLNYVEGAMCVNPNNQEERPVRCKDWKQIAIKSEELAMSFDRTLKVVIIIGRVDD